MIIISDLDDTIKISHTQSKLVTVYRGLFRSSAFAGMSELYRSMLRLGALDPNGSFFILSSSPPAIRKKIEYFLTKHGFPKAKLILRDWIREPSILKYKMRRLHECLETAAEPVVLFGDDTEHDPEVFTHMKKKFPGKILAIYIRSVRGRELPEGVTPFYTAFDVACSELAAGRLDNEQVLRVGEAVLAAEKNSWLIPYFSLKPPLGFSPFATALEIVDESLVELWKKIHSRIETIERRRK